MRSDGTVYVQARWREDGQQKTMSFDDLEGAESFCRLVDTHGPEQARRVLQLRHEAADALTLDEWLTAHIDGLTGIQAATRNRYHSFRTVELAELGMLPLTTITPEGVGRWVSGLKGSGKTIQNKHAFLSGALKAAVHAGHIPSNPAEGRRLPRTTRKEMVFLSRPEFDLLRTHIPHDRWKNLATWLAATGMRFSEATALTAADIDAAAGTCRIWRSWKYSGTFHPELGPPKSRKSVRTINLPPQALAAIDLTAADWLFTNGAGSPVRAQEFYNLGWKPGRERAAKAGLTKKPRVHDLRHTCASWMIAAGIPLPVIQQHLGHEDIRTTVGTYGHLDRSAAKMAADAISAAMG